MDLETRYSPIEKLCLCLYFSCTKLRHYLLSAECTVVSNADVIKYMLSMPILNRRMRKWILALSEFDLRYESTKVVKGQVIADFITQHHKPSIGYIELIHWTLFFDGSSCKQGGGIGIVIVSPWGQVLSLLFQLNQWLPTIKQNMKLFLRDFNFFMK